MRQRKLATDAARGAGGAAPAGGTGGVPLFLKRWRVGRWDNGAGHANPPLKKGAGQTRPSVERGRKPEQDLRPPAGCRGRSPRRGYRGSPPVSKNVGGWSGRDSGAGHANPPLKKGASQDKTIRPHWRADAGVRGLRQPPIAKSERVCYNAPRKWAASPLRFLEACRRREHWESTVNPCGRGAQGASPAAPMAATKPALGQGAPGGCSPSPATLRGRLGPERAPWRGKPLGAATGPRWLAMDARWIRDGCAMHPRWLRDG